jgi:glutamate--cysteine ligase
LPWTSAQQAQFETMARESVLAQRRIESEDTMPFEIYRQEYLAPRRLGG